MLSTRKLQPRSCWLFLHKGQFTFLFPGEKVYGSRTEVRFGDACSADTHQAFGPDCRLWDHRSKIKQFWVTTFCMNLLGYGFQRTQRFKANTRHRLETCSTYSLQSFSKLKKKKKENNLRFTSNLVQEPWKLWSPGLWFMLAEKPPRKQALVVSGGKLLAAPYVIQLLLRYRTSKELFPFV